MRYSSIIPNDVVNGEGVCVSFFVQGCPHHCPGCFNKETWDFHSGKEYTSELKWEIIKLISDNGITRNFSILGGEPMALQNLEMTYEIVDAVRHAYPNIKIFLWTGYTINELFDREDYTTNIILEYIDVLIDGPFIEEKRNLNLKLRGSNNQHIYRKVNGYWEIEE